MCVHISWPVKNIGEKPRSNMVNQRTLTHAHQEALHSSLFVSYLYNYFKVSTDFGFPFREKTIKPCSPGLSGGSVRIISLQWCSLVIRVESCKYCDYRRVRIWWLLLRYWDDIEIPEHPPHPTPPHTLTDTVVIPGFVGSTDGGLGLWWLDGWMVGRWVGRTITLSKLSRYLSGLGNNWTLKIHKREGAKLKEASGHPGSPYQRFKNATFRTLSQPGRLLSVSDQSILSWIVLTALTRLGHGG